MTLEEIKEWVADNSLCARTLQMVVEHLIDKVERLQVDLDGINKGGFPVKNASYWRREAIKTQQEVEQLRKVEIPAAYNEGLKEDFPNIDALCDGRFSGRISEWPHLKQEVRRMRAENNQMKNSLKTLPYFRAACKEFVKKVEAGEAKSVRSYAQMKEAFLIEEKVERGDL